MKRKFDEWLSIQTAKNPARVVLGSILLFNIVFLLFSAAVISNFSLRGTEHMNFLQAAFCTVTMILDAGCVQFVIEDIGQASVALSLFCLLVILVGMISFTGAVIGYLTNYISRYVENASTGIRKWSLSNHVVILNWNSRASEIVNDLLYCKDKQTVVVMVAAGKKEVEKEVEERLADTLARENEGIRARCAELSLLKKIKYYRKNKLRNNITLLVREGDIFSSMQLHDISLEKARTVIILGNEDRRSICRLDQEERDEQRLKGNTLTVKTLMQVADITGDVESADNQRIIVEITDPWTAQLVEKIIKAKQVDGKCNIVPVMINKILGQILSQFSLMPELNLAYRELFSNKGATFFSYVQDKTCDEEFIPDFLKFHKNAIPLTVMESEGKYFGYFSASDERASVDFSFAPITAGGYTVDLNYDYHIENKNVVIIGHNSKCRDIMTGFESFRHEWNYKDGIHEILRIIVIDDEKNLEKMNYYRDYPFVIKTVAGSVYDTDLITQTIQTFSDSNAEDTSILILSDDTVYTEEVDADVLSNLVYAQDLIKMKAAQDPEFDRESIDIVAEILDPKHHDVVSAYSVDNIVISNRYISKMITQIGEKDAMFNFYTDILTYDDDDVGGYQSKEIYAKKVGRFFRTVPAPCHADEFIRAVYAASTDPSIPPEKQNPTLVLGYVKPGGKMVLFEGDQSKIQVELGEKDKIIVFSNH